MKPFWVGVGVIALVMCAGCSKKQEAASKAGSPVKVVVEVFDRGTDGGKTNPTNNEWTKWIQEKILADENIRVEFTAVSRWEEVTALNNMMAAGNPPDVCLTYSNELVASYRDKGGLRDLSPYVDTLLSDTKAFLGPDTALPGRDLIRRNEDPQTKAIYAIPARRMNVAMRNIFMRKDWLDKLGLPLPATTEEFYQALKAFKEKDPGGVGKQNVVPYIMNTEVHWGTHTIGRAFFDVNASTKDIWVNIAADRFVTVPGYKEAVRFMNKLYNEGLVDPGFAVYKSEADEHNVIKAGFAGAFDDVWDRVFRDGDNINTYLGQNVPGAEFVAVNALTSSDGKIHKMSYDAAGLNVFVPASCKNPEAAVRYINWISRYENYHFLQIGKEGVSHDIVNGVPKLKTVTGPWIQNSLQNIDYTLTINGLDLGDEELTLKALANSYSWPAEKIEDAYNKAMFNAAPLPVIPVTLTEAGPYVQTIIDKTNVLLTKSITAKPADFDSVWEAGKKDWLLSGGQAVIDERAAKYFEP